MNSGHWVYQLGHMIEFQNQAKNNTQIIIGTSSNNTGRQPRKHLIAETLLSINIKVHEDWNLLRLTKKHTNENRRKWSKDAKNTHKKTIREGDFNRQVYIKISTEIMTNINKQQGTQVYNDQSSQQRQKKHNGHACLWICVGALSRWRICKSLPPVMSLSLFGNGYYRPSMGLYSSPMSSAFKFYLG